MQLEIKGDGGIVRLTNCTLVRSRIAFIATPKAEKRRNRRAALAQRLRQATEEMDDAQ